MDRKARTGSPPYPSPPPPSQLYGTKGSSPSSPRTWNQQSSQGLFDSVFSPAAPLEGTNSSTSDIFGPQRKLENANPSGNPHNKTGDGKYGYCPDKERKFLNKDKISIYQSERTGPCSLSNSLYYGGQDICVQPPSSSYTNKNDDEDDDPESPHFASRGNWWQGSLYY